MHDPRLTPATALRVARQRAGHSQVELAEISGVSIRTIRAMETGETTTPRRATLTMLTDALHLRGDDRIAFLRRWGVDEPETRQVRSVDQMVAPDDGYAVVREAVRNRVDRLEVVYAANRYHVHDRQIVAEEHERVVVPVHADVTGTVYTTSFGLDGTEPVMTALDGCSIGGRTSLDVRVVLFEIDFGRRLALGEPHHYRTRIDYPGCPRRRRVDDQESDRALVGLHRTAAACLVHVQFDPADVPRRCDRLYEDRAGEADGPVGEVPISAAAMASIVLVTPPAGWHGMSWSWS